MARADAVRAWPVVAVVLCAAPLWGQEPTAVPELTHRGVRAALDRLEADNAWTVEQQISICEIPAPPFKERARAAEFQQRLQALGYRDVRIDAAGNVIARRPGRGGGATVVLSAHLDTVFPEATDVAVRRDGLRLHGPGIGDDCRGLAVVLAVARALAGADVETRGDVLFVGTVGEEGAGNLRGVRHLFTRELPGRIDYFISVDGTGLGLTTTAVGSHRYRITYHGPGGHSYGAFGMPNPTHALGRAIAKIARFQVPGSPKTTFNVGVIGGGTSVNSIAQEAWMDVDMRSESPAALDRVVTRFWDAIQDALDEERAQWAASRTPLAYRVDTIGIRPAGTQPDSATIVRTALAAARALRFTSTPTAASTDANLPISLGIPAITIDGGGSGRGAHSTAEWYEDGAQGWLGPQWAALITLALAGVR